MEGNMPQLTISRDIRPISDLKVKSSEIVNQVTIQQEALLAALCEGKRDFGEGRVLTHKEMRTKWSVESDQGAEG
jgi:predicted transcriptional regulator